MSDKVTYIQQVAARLSDMMGKPIAPHEWGRLGKIIKTYGKECVEKAIKDFEDDEVTVTLTSLGLFHSIVSKIHKKDIILNHNEVSEKIHDRSERGKKILGDLLNG